MPSSRTLPRALRRISAIGARAGSSLFRLGGPKVGYKDELPRANNDGVSLRLPYQNRTGLLAPTQCGLSESPLSRCCSPGGLRDHTQRHPCVASAVSSAPVLGLRHCTALFFDRRDDGVTMASPS